MNELQMAPTYTVSGLDLGQGFDRGQAIEKVSYSHDKMIDLIVANPRVKQGALAAYFGYTEAWVSRVMSSDAFKVRMATRRVELVDPLIVASLEERFKALAQRGLEVMQEKLDQPASVVAFGDAAKAAEIGAKGLALGGFGQKISVDVNTTIDLRAAIEEGHARRKELRMRTVEPSSQGLASDRTSQPPHELAFDLDSEVESA